MSKVSETNDNKAMVERVLHHWQKLLGEGSVMEFKKGQVLFYAGHVPYGAFVLVSGSVALAAEDVKQRRHAKALTLYEPFGLDLLTLGLAYPCTAIAEKDACVLFLSKAALELEPGKKTRCDE